MITGKVSDIATSPHSPIPFYDMETWKVYRVYGVPNKRYFDWYAIRCGPTNLLIVDVHDTVTKHDGNWSTDWMYSPAPTVKITLEIS